MNNAMTPAIGSNQFVTKFDEKEKTKRKKIKVRFVVKLQIFAVLLLAASLYSNYQLLNNFMVFKCSPGVYGISKAKCDELKQNLFDSQELDRQVRQNEMLINNPDLR